VTETSNIKNEIALKKIVQELETWTVEPRVFSVAQFIDMATTVVHYDKFVGIMELDPETEDMVYVAFGRSPAGNFGDGHIELIDMRYTNDPDLWERSITAFDSLVNDKNPDYIREIEGKWSPKIIITHIVDTWQLVAEQSRSTIH